MLSDYIPSHSGIMALACRHPVDWRPRVPPHFWLSLSWSLSTLETLSSFFMLQSTCIQSCIKISCIQFSLAQCFLSSLREHICFVYLCVSDGALCKVGTQSILLNSSTQLLRLLKLKPITKVSCFISFKFQSKVRAYSKYWNLGLIVTEWCPVTSIILLRYGNLGSSVKMQTNSCLAWGFGRRLKCLCSHPWNDWLTLVSQSLVRSPIWGCLHSPIESGCRTYYCFLTCSLHANSIGLNIYAAPKKY